MVALIFYNPASNSDEVIFNFKVIYILTKIAENTKMQLFHSTLFLATSMKTLICVQRLNLVNNISTRAHHYVVPVKRFCEYHQILFYATFWYAKVFD